MLDDVPSLSIADRFFKSVNRIPSEEASSGGTTCSCSRRIRARSGLSAVFVPIILERIFPATRVGSTRASRGVIVAGSGDNLRICTSGKEPIPMPVLDVSGNKARRVDGAAASAWAKVCELRYSRKSC